MTEKFENATYRTHQGVFFGGNPTRTTYNIVYLLHTSTTATYYDHHNAQKFGYLLVIILKNVAMVILESLVTLSHSANKNSKYSDDIEHVCTLYSSRKVPITAHLHDKFVL